MQADHYPPQSTIAGILCNILQLSTLGDTDQCMSMHIQGQKGSALNHHQASEWLLPNRSCWSHAQHTWRHDVKGGFFIRLQVLQQGCLQLGQPGRRSAGQSGERGGWAGRGERGSVCGVGVLRGHS